MPINLLNFSLLSPHLLPAHSQRSHSCTTLLVFTHCPLWMPTDHSPPTACSTFQAGADKQMKDRTPFIFSDIHLSWVTADDSLYRSRYIWSVTGLKGCTYFFFHFSGLLSQSELNGWWATHKVPSGESCLFSEGRKERSKWLAPSKDYTKESQSSFYYSITCHRSMESHTLHVPIGKQPAHPPTTVFLSILLCAYLSPAQPFLGSSLISSLHIILACA